ncbi:hypothetical protein AMECASPLE_038112, partial [Ameca splendens]
TLDTTTEIIAQQRKPGESLLFRLSFKGLLNSSWQRRSNKKVCSRQIVLHHKEWQD